MDIEQLKTDVSLWPDGASHCIGEVFTRWVHGDEYSYIDGDWIPEKHSDSLDRYTTENWFEVIERPSPLIKAIESNGPLLDAHTAIEALTQALMFYADGSIYHKKADGLFTIAQEDAGQLAQEAIERAKEALADIEEAVDNG